jgi:hypothetical protein
MIISLEGLIPTLDLRRKWNQLRGLQQEKGIKTPQKIIHDYKKRCSKKTMTLALFAHELYSEVH